MYWMCCWLICSILIVNSMCKLTFSCYNFSSGNTCHFLDEKSVSLPSASDLMMISSTASGSRLGITRMPSTERMLQVVLSVVKLYIMETD